MKPLTPQIQRTLQDALETERQEWGDYGALQETRAWLEELAAYWPSLADCPDGVDIFEGRYPVTGAPGVVDDNAVSV